MYQQLTDYCVGKKIDDVAKKEIKHSEEREELNRLVFGNIII